ncbi:MAG TPA: hypothetical protein VMU15_10935 [Anaeromyxobacter sp.]|nr:hypothetical protein [Anaeromyxobacter sp.]
MNWRAFRGRDSGNWVAISDALKLTVQGDSWDDLMNACTEAVQLVLLDVFEDGDFEQFLRSRGWMLLSQLPARGQPVKFDIPVQVLKAANGELRVPVQ